MTDNDYIAEYVREKHSGILGVDFAMWKLGRKMGEFAGEIAKTLRSIPTEQLKGAMLDRYPGETTDILKKIEESGDYPEDTKECDDISEYEGECRNDDRTN